VVIPDLSLPPSVVRGQGPITGTLPQYAPAEPALPVPLGSTRPEDGGLYLSLEYMMYRQTDPLHEQNVAVRGFQVSDKSFSTAGIPGTQPLSPGQFIGSGTPALDVAQLTGQDSYQPGFRIGAGYKFGDGSALYVTWFYLTEASYRAAATLNPPGGTGARDNSGLSTSGQNLADTFLFSPVFNYPPQFNGPQFKVNPTNALNGNAVGSVSSQFVSGIWNGASIMTLSFLQRFQDWEITYRQPIYETETMRVNGLVGPRYTWIWERFRWWTTSFGDDGSGNLTAGPQDQGIYSNITSNRMYGVFTGCQTECYLGHGFACMLECKTSLYLDSVKEIARYETAAKFLGFPENKRAKIDWNIVPEFQGTLGIMWYAWENVQLQFAYQLMAFLNTRASSRPIDFDYSNLAPKWNSTNRLFDGFNVGVGIHF
jgi:hypothetical protein